MFLNRVPNKEKIYTMEYYSTVKKNDIMKTAGKWLELERNHE